MACFSSIATKLTDGARIEESMKALGFTDIRTGNKHSTISGMLKGKRVTFSKSYGDVYNASDSTELVPTVAKKYAEIGVRQWAKRNGYTVAEKNGNKITLVNRSKS
jgi:effector-binding domain-containing protein